MGEVVGIDCSTNTGRALMDPLEQRVSELER